MERRVYSNAWLSLFPVAYLAHLADERWFWIGTADFSTRYFGIYFTNSAWWAVNVPSMIVLTLATATLWRARSAFSRREAVNGLIAGLASFQPLWHFALLPVLPRGPTAFYEGESVKPSSDDAGGD